jgi:hypothetical protein
MSDVDAADAGRRGPTTSKPKLLAWIEGMAFACGIAAGVLAVVGHSSKVVLGVASVLALCLGGGAELWSDSSLREQPWRLQARVLAVGALVVGGVIGLGLTTGGPDGSADPGASDTGEEDEQAGNVSSTSTTQPGGDRPGSSSTTANRADRSRGSGSDATTGTSTPLPPGTDAGGHTVTSVGTAPATTAAPTTAPPPTAPPGPTRTERQGSLGADTFLDPANASSKGPRVEAWAYVEVACKVHAPQIESANPDGYWYRLASAPWNGLYYAVANTFWNSDVPGQPPYDSYTDWAVPDC